LVLLFRRGSSELVHAGKKLARPLLQFGQTLKVDLLVAAGERLQGAVNEVNDSSLAGTRRTVGRDDACCDGVDFRCLFRSKEFEFWRSSGASGLARVVYGGESVRPVRGNPRGGDGGDTAEEKLPARKCVLHSKALSKLHRTL